MQTTTNLGLKKPEGTDVVNIQDLNDNTDLLDSVVAAKETPAGAQAKANTAETNAKSYADTKVAALVNSSPTTLDTLKELATALGNDANYAATTAALIGTKASQVTVDAHLAEEAQLYAQWDAEDLTLVSGILTTDSLCWQGKNVQYTQPATSMGLVTIAKATHAGLRFGKFSVGFRVKCTNITSTNTVTTLKVLDAAGNVVSSIALKGTDFQSATAYKMFYIAFDNMGQSAGNVFTFAVTSEAVASVTISIDSILVAPVHVGNYV
ncbi:MAG TPA: hypothetical protein VN456_03540 [Desulfosporosinus sp.]|nr:hypothetical protein [Desulfosporosinus sp.]